MGNGRRYCKIPVPFSRRLEATIGTGDEDAADAAPGWDAITRATDRLYPGQEPRHVGTIAPLALGGHDPLSGISVWRRADPVPHWHYVTYGFSELYGKQWSDPAVSGYGFELTFRLARDAMEDGDPLGWVFSLLQNVARYVFRTGNGFDDGHWMNANGPISLDHKTIIESIGFIFDPELPAIDTPNGRLAFLQMVGLTLDEERAAKHWDTRKLLEALQPAMPLWVTDLSRHSLLERSDIRERVEEGTRRDGSSTGLILTDVLDWRVERHPLRSASVAITIGAAQIEGLTTLLRLRLPFGRPLHVIGGSVRIAFTPGDADIVHDADDELCVQLTPATVDVLERTLRARAGTYAVPSLAAVRWDVQESPIRDMSGKVIRTIG